MTDDGMSIEDVFRRHFKIESERAEILAEWFACSTWGNSTPFYSRSKDIESLVKLRNAISTLVRFEREGDGAAQELFRQTLVKLDIETDAPERLDRNAPWHPKAHGSWIEANRHLKTWIKAAERAITELEKSGQAVRSKSRVNVEAINIVDRARRIWKIHKGSSAPVRGLSPGTAFESFLSDLLIACECQADPRSAFQAWARHMGEAVHSEGETG